jgi:DNA-binding transcriptional MerR regulator
MDQPTSPTQAVFNIGAVTRMTGIPTATLHSWERRYGFPSPSGYTAGGHRLYSEKDIELLRSIKAQIDHGVSARQAVAAVQKMDEEGRLFQEVSSELPRLPDLLPDSPQLREHLAEALYRHDLELADRLMGEMLAFYSPEEITLNIISPVLAELGEAWASGRINVSDEHLASNYLRQRLLMWLVTGPPTRQVRPIVLACAPGEWHEGSLLMLSVLLRRRGWPVAYLGQNVPFADLAAHIEQVHPSAVVLVAMLAESARELTDWPKWISQVNGMPPITFGGRAFVIQPELKKQVQGTYLGDDLQEGLTRLEEILR